MFGSFQPPPASSAQTKGSIHVTRIGIVGVGFMGMIHYLAAKKIAGVEVVAIVTRDEKKRNGDWTSIQGNFGPRGGHEDLSNVKCYESVEQLLNDENVDLVDICLPNQLHAKIATQALDAGKHVLVEKAIALTVEDADAMLKAAEKSGKILQVAHVLPFFPDFGYVHQLATKGTYGKIKAAHFRRHISPPDWSAEMSDLDSQGGPIVDLHIHDTHFVNLMFGPPNKVLTQGVFEGQALHYVTTQYFYDHGPAVTATSGAISRPSRPFTHGLEVYFEKATVMYEAGGDLVVYTDDEVLRPELGSADPIDSFALELTAACEALQTGGAHPVLSPVHARNALDLALKEEQSARQGEIVTI